MLVRILFFSVVMKVILVDEGWVKWLEEFEKRAISSVNDLVTKNLTLIKCGKFRFALTQQMGLYRVR